MSGGAIMGMYHIGVVQALIEADCLPKVIAGSSAGSIIAGFIATHTRDELQPRLIKISITQYKPVLKYKWLRVSMTRITLSSRTV